MQNQVFSSQIQPLSSKISSHNIHCLFTPQNSKNSRQLLAETTHPQHTRYPPKLKTIRKTRKRHQSAFIQLSKEKEGSSYKKEERSVSLQEMEEEEMSRMLDSMIESQRGAVGVGLSRRGAEILPKGYERCNLCIQIKQWQFKEEFSLSGQIPRTRQQIVHFQGNIQKEVALEEKEKDSSQQERERFSIESKDLDDVSQYLDIQSNNGSEYRSHLSSEKPEGLIQCRAWAQSEEDSPFDSQGCYKPCRKPTSRQQALLLSSSRDQNLNARKCYNVPSDNESADRPIIRSIQVRSIIMQQGSKIFDVPLDSPQRIAQQPYYPGIYGQPNCPIAQAHTLTDPTQMQSPILPVPMLPEHLHPADKHSLQQVPKVHEPIQQAGCLEDSQKIKESEEQEEDEAINLQQMQQSVGDASRSKSLSRENISRLMKPGSGNVENQQQEEDEIEEIREDDYMKSFRLSSLLAPKSRLISKRSDYCTKEVTLTNKSKPVAPSLFIYKPKPPGTVYEEVRQNIDDKTITWSMMARGWVPRLVKILDVLEVDEARYVYGLFWGEREQLIERFVMMPHFLDFYGGQLQRYEISDSKQKTITVTIAQTFD